MPMVRSRREAIANRLQTKLEKSASRFARLATKKGSRTRTAQRYFKREVRIYMLQMAIAGKGSPLTPSELRRLEKKIMKQEQYLQKFCDKISVNRMKKTPLSVNAIRSQAELYAGQGRAEFFRFAGKTDATGNTVEKYVAVAGACRNCQPHNGKYFLPGSGPMPGEICLGKGRCRCRRVQEDNARIAKRLKAAA